MFFREFVDSHIAKVTLFLDQESDLVASGKILRRDW
jgi:hypothetical protein